MECPLCGSENASIERYDFGRCPETGYDDSGELLVCGECGTWDTYEVDRLIEQREEACQEN